MPKEVISNDAMFKIAVSWGKKDTDIVRMSNDDDEVVSVQLVLDNGFSPNLIKHLLLHYTTEIGKELKSLAASAQHYNWSDVEYGVMLLGILEKMTPYDGVGIFLDREDCNTLIKHLRKARDQSFKNTADRPMLHATTLTTNTNQAATRENLLQTIAYLQSEHDRLYGKDQ